MTQNYDELLREMETRRFNRDGTSEINCSRAATAIRTLLAERDASYNQAIEDAAKTLAKKQAEYDAEYGNLDHSKGVTEYPGNGNEMMYDWSETEEAILQIKRPTP